MIGQIGASRPAYYDRNGITRTNDYQGEAIAPAAAATKWSYTVPSNKKGFGEFLIVSVRRVAAAAPVGVVYAYVTFTPNGAAVDYIMFMAFRNNAIGDTETQVVSSLGAMYAGDNMYAVAGDTSTGGSVDFLIAMKASEYDA
jgi:hypothetical protein